MSPFGCDSLLHISLLLLTKNGIIYNGIINNFRNGLRIEMTITASDILQAVCDLNDPNIGWCYEKNTQDEEFIKATINGDEVKAYLPIIANLKPKTLGTLLYILTNVRLIKIEISSAEKINSMSYFLNSMTNIDRKLIEENKISVNIIFQNTSFGLTYSIEDRDITEFFQKIEDLKAKKGSINDTAT
jgi:hypothetical protein